MWKLDPPGRHWKENLGFWDEVPEKSAPHLLFRIQDKRICISGEQNQHTCVAGVKRRKRVWFGYVMSPNNLSKTILQGTVEGARRWGDSGVMGSRWWCGVEVRWQGDGVGCAAAQEELLLMLDFHTIYYSHAFSFAVLRILISIHPTYKGLHAGVHDHWNACIQHFFIHVSIYSYICFFMHTYIHTRTHTNTQVCIHTYRTDIMPN